MPIDTPTALVEEFKKSGEFDRLRRELLAQFQQDESYAGFKEGVETIARERLASDQSLYYQGADVALKELSQEIQRYPIVERAVANVRTLSDPTLLAGVQKSMQKILRDQKAKEEKSSSSASASSSSKKGPEDQTVRKEVVQTTGNQAEKPTQDVDMEDKAPEHIVSSTSLQEDSQKSTESPTTTKNIISSASGSSIPSEQPNSTESNPAESDAMEVDPSSSSISAQNSNVKSPIDDQRQTSADIEMKT